MEDVGRKDPSTIAIVEAALILEAGVAKRFDRLIVVTSNPEQRAARWAQRTHTDDATARAEVTRRMAAQLPDEEKIKAADHVIDNSGSLDATEKQVGEVYARLQETLAKNGRAHWFAEEVADLVDPAIYRSDPAEAWRRFRLRGRVDQRFLGVLRALAA